MRKVRPSVPPECDVIGYLYHDEDPTCLGEDMIEVVHPAGVIIDAGWYPEGDSRGVYRVSMRRGLKAEIPLIETQDVDEAAAIVADWAARV